jgi:hypothetical protein
MAILHHTVTEAQHLGMGVDMTAGSGWCFGGPWVTDREANAAVVVKTFDLAAGAKLEQRFDKTLQALVAFSTNGMRIELTDKIDSAGSVAWAPEGGDWRVYAISQKPSGQKVKRAAPGGEGHMLNLFYARAMTNYLRWFEAAFAGYQGPKPRALYHDSYEYRSDWSPNLFREFAKRRGYRLETELPALFGRESTERAARVKCDYRETLSDLMAEETLPLWVNWSHQHGFLTRNEAHGSPGNWLDLYAVADIPETEMFYKDRSKLVSKFASSAAHVSGKNLTASETGTWLKEHFTETLADVKYLFDDLFLSGINHIFYHGTCYSPDEAGWPGWHFYASLEMNPRNSIWHDASAVNAYAARCQSILQSGRPDNGILLYWPIHDFWQNPAGLVRPMTVHARDWLEDQPIGAAAQRLWNRGYAFDYVSDRQLTSAKSERGRVIVRGGNYRVVVVPACTHIPLETMKNLIALADGGATVVFEKELPADVPGFANFEQRRGELKQLLGRLNFGASRSENVKSARVGRGQVLVGELEAALVLAGVARESMFDHPGLMCVRRATQEGTCYFIANRSEQSALNDWVPLARPAASVAVMDPLDGRAGVGSVRQTKAGNAEVFLQLQPGESVILRCSAKGQIKLSPWPYWEAASQPVPLLGEWQVKFIEGGPELPAPFVTSQLRSWTELGETNAQRFAGTARYSLTFDEPAPASEHWWLELGKVCKSARVRLNGQELGTLIIPPFRAVTGPLKPRGNLLEIEVTNLSANRIRDLDLRGVKWKSYHDINFVNLDYRPFDASSWPLTDSGLLGPVTITGVKQRSF